MLSTGMMWLLIAIYAGISLTAMFERNWPRALYFFGAIVISLAVLWMTNHRPVDLPN